MSSLNKGRANEPLLNKTLQLHQESVFDTESKYSISSFASTRLPTLSSFSGPTSQHQGQLNNHQAPSKYDNVLRSSTGLISSSTVQASYQSKARSNFVLGPTKSVIFDRGGMQNQGKYISSASTRSASNVPTASMEFQQIPTLAEQYMSVNPNSYFPSMHDSHVKGVDENIYHWKVLNLSRAKLKASSRTSALLSGFAMVAMVEIQISDNVPQWLLITFSATTVLLIAVHMLALMISTCILPNVEAVANLHFQTSKTVHESPHMKMNAIVELAWGFSTVLGILLFLLEIAILCWVKFYHCSPQSAWVATGLLIPIMIVFIAFAAHFYLKLVSHKSEVYEDGIKELELLKGQLIAEEDHEADEKGDNVTPKSVVQVV